MKLHPKVVAAAMLSALSLPVAMPAQASIYTNSFSVFVSEGTTSGPFDTATGNPFAVPTQTSNTAAATFVYTGPLNFSNTAGQNTGLGDTNSAFGFTADNVSKYNDAACVGKGCNIVTSSGMQVANLNNKAGFLASSGSSGQFMFGSYFEFDLGSVQAGTVLTITHDDGISLFQNGSQIGSTTSGATSATTDTVRFDATGDTILRYSRQNGTPSILQVAVPEPMSLSLLGAGLVGLGLVRRRKAG